MKRFLEEELIKWRNKKQHLPLLLRGARQVGKSYLVEQFGKLFFENLIVVDFEKREEFKKYFVSKDPKDIVNKLEMFFQEKIIPGKTLLFFDEIQECPEALISLRYFKELMPNLHVIAAGSLVEFLLNDSKFSFPVGRVEFLYLKPFSLLEFLNVLAPIAFERLKSIELSKPLSNEEHKEMNDLVRKYLLIGGMPAAIEAYLLNDSFLDAQTVHHRILQSYESDFGKYSTHLQYKFLYMIFQKSPLLVGQILKFSNIDRETRSRDLKLALNLLTRSGLIQQIFATTASGVPLHAHIKDHRFKLLFLDVGLLQTASQVDAEDIFEKKIIQINNGMIAEQFVGQELMANANPYQNKPLLFWEREKGSSEVDYIISINSKIIPVEVKSGMIGKLKSLHYFLKIKNKKLGIRISEKNLFLDKNILSIPFYLINYMSKIIKTIDF